MTGDPKPGDRVRQKSWTGSRGKVINVYSVANTPVALVLWQAHGPVPPCTAPCKLDDLAVVND